MLPDARVAEPTDAREPDADPWMQGLQYLVAFVAAVAALLLAWVR